MTSPSTPNGETLAARGAGSLLSALEEFDPALGNPDRPDGVKGDVTTRRLTPVIGVQRSSGETVPGPELEPIFIELARRWETDDRLVPGRADEEWTILARRYSWPGR
ncbi:hypothetical protein ATE80_12005 [Streptomyces kanasensis]|uniref:Uncharacterized protein n=1 Tax=Streptomyces kanasensis TaxID=936756 RepID=A0A100Y6L4_9ACTN|nr:hypothetical protein ATE80_12005 [Streptomyces kanasensis]